VRIILSYKINEYITLKLERNRTEIYIKDRLFRQCKFLIITVPIEDFKNYDQIDSIDEAAEISGRSIDKYKANVDPETEFWGHCSNLQVWVENQYDTRLLHRTIAFPLLKKLTEVGDPLAKKVFKDEIATRFVNGNNAVITFLLKERYLNFLNNEELDTLISEFDFTKIRWKNNFEYIEFLKKLRNMGSKNAQKKLNDLLIHLFLNEELKKDSRIFTYLKEVPEEILADAANNIDFEKYRTDLWILKNIANLKIEKGITILKEEIIKRISSKDLSEIGLILYNDHHFLKIFTLEELEMIFDKFDHNIILSLDTDKALRLFSQLLSVFKQRGLSKYDSLKKQFLSELKSKFLNASFTELPTFLHSSYINYLQKEELINLMDQYDYSRILLNKTQTILPILKECSDKGSKVAQKLFLEELKKRFIEGDSNEVKFIYEKYLNLLSESEVRDLFNKLPMIKLDLKLLQEFANLGYKKAINAYKEKLKTEQKLEKVETLKQNILQKVKEHSIKESYKWLSKELDTNYPSDPFNLLINQDIEEIASHIFTNNDIKSKMINTIKDSGTRYSRVPFTIPYKFILLFLKGSKSAINFFNSIAVERLNEAKLIEIAFLGRKDYIDYLNQQSLALFNLKNTHILSLLTKAYLVDKEYALVLIILKRMAKKGDSSAKYILTELVKQFYNKESINLKDFLNKEGYVQINEDGWQVVEVNEQLQISDDQKQAIKEKYKFFFDLSSINESLIGLLDNRFKNYIRNKLYRTKLFSRYRYQDLADILLREVIKLSPENKQKIKKIFYQLLKKSIRKPYYYFGDYEKERAREREFAALYLGYLDEKYRFKSPDTIKAIMEQERSKKIFQDLKLKKTSFDFLKFNTLMQSFKLKELHHICRKYGVGGYTQHRKQELINHIAATLEKEKLDKIVKLAQKKIIKQVIDQAREIIRGNSNERIMNLTINDSHPSNINLGFKGKNWEVLTTINFKTEDINQLSYKCNCGEGNNLRYCSHFWVGLIYLLKQNLLDLSEWKLTPLPDQLAEIINTLSFKTS